MVTLLIENINYCMTLHIKKGGLAITVLTFHYIIPHTPNMVTVIILDEKNKSLSHFLIILSLYTSNFQVNAKFTSSVFFIYTDTKQFL